MTLPNPPSTLPTTDTRERYRMGPLFTETPDIDFWWNATLDDGTVTICGEPVGWEGVTYLLPLDQVGGRDGAHTGPQSVAPKTLECSALIVAPNSQILRSRLAQLRTMFGPQGATGTRQLIVWEQYDYGASTRLALLTRPSGEFHPVVLGGPSKGGQAAAITFTLIAANPVTKYQSGAVQFGEVGLFNAGATSGRTYDKTYSWTYGGGGNPGGEMTVVNSGNTLAWPVFIVTGEADDPIITNVTTGQDFQVSYDLASLEVVTINSQTGQVTPSSARLIGRPFSLVPGPNTIRWRTQSGAYHSEARLRLEWRSTFS